ncbi:hypothetical protein Q1695_009407 [Nippostrongylus brasiliensis]|nr:hypothetical protein Q1695_009407 [Nippostrongylus brasiliensis]
MSYSHTVHGRPPIESLRVKYVAFQDTLYKVLDDFPDLILPPMTNIDRSLPYLRELCVQETPAQSPVNENVIDKAKNFMRPLVSVDIDPQMKKFNMFDNQLLRATQSATEEVLSKITQAPNQAGENQQQQQKPQQKQPQQLQAPSHKEQAQPSPQEVIPADAEIPTQAAASTSKCSVVTAQRLPKVPPSQRRGRRTIRDRLPIKALRKLIVGGEGDGKEPPK